ncbi:MAG: tetratricopeptide repeat protein [Desulfobacteraceae bacterium]|nr:tetratricopeptide repeat protein [Desulfobacteraceae bacterium]
MKTIIKQFILILSLLVLLPLYAMAAKETIPPGVGICVNKVNLLLQQNKIEQAVSVLEAFSAKQHTHQHIRDKKKAEQKGYNHYYIDFLLGNCFLMLDQEKKSSDHIEKAANAYDSAVKKRTDFSPAWLNLAKCRYDLGQMEKAAIGFTKGYETSKEKKPNHLFYASTCYTFTKNYETALKVFNRLLLAHPEEIKLEWKETLVNILFSLEKYKQALPFIEELTHKFQGKKKKKWQEILLYQYLSLKMKQKALEYVGFLTKTDPTEPKWWKALTHIHLNENRLEEGLASLLIYSFISPLSQQEISLMADLYLSCGIPLKGAETLEKWLEKEIDQGQNQAQNQNQVHDKISRISHAYMQGFQNDNALRWINKGLAIKKDPDLLQIKADLLFGQKKYKQALDTYKQLSKFKKHKGQALLMMGYAAWNDNQIKNAITFFTQASSHGKQKKAAQKALVHLKKIGEV